MRCSAHGSLPGWPCSWASLAPVGDHDLDEGEETCASVSWEQPARSWPSGSERQSERMGDGSFHLLPHTAAGPGAWDSVRSPGAEPRPAWRAGLAGKLASGWGVTQPLECEAWASLPWRYKPAPLREILHRESRVSRSLPTVLTAEGLHCAGFCERVAFTWPEHDPAAAPALGIVGNADSQAPCSCWLGQPCGVTRVQSEELG